MKSPNYMSNVVRGDNKTNNDNDDDFQQQSERN